jgi:2-succinyl-5-enolpyruvyl-6-hydroxy-3-cyclohexene-1-carboxylate synthase
MIHSTNQELAIFTLGQLEKLGVKTLCICPGARNSPWLSELEKSSQFEKLYFFDERSAGFFALSRARAQLAPVAVLTTSGTAVGELLPAMMEAFYSGAPLWVLSADRPQRFRTTGAPQSCEQEGIFGVYAKWCVELDRSSSLKNVKNEFSAPEIGSTAHWNVCFEEPLPSSEKNRTSGENELKTLQHSEIPSILKMAKNPLVIVGELTTDEARVLRDFLVTAKLPVITEPLSHLREEPTLDSLRIRPTRGLWEEAQKCDYPIDLVLRFGGMPTLRFWRDLEVHPEALKVPVISVGRLNFRGLVRALHVHTDLKTWLKDQRVNWEKPSFQKWHSYQKSRVEVLEKAISEYPESEASWIRSLSQTIPKGSEIYLGNSLPIREWDLAASYEEKEFTFRANRGLNGIDGQLSSFFGGLKKDLENWCILGDLTALYDTNAPWILSQLDPSIRWHLVIINNSGGRIFERMFSSPLYQNQHQLSFEHWAQHWGLSYERGNAAKNFTAQVIEIIPDETSSRSFWNAWEPL